MDFIILPNKVQSRSQKKKELHKLLVARSDISASVIACKVMISESIEMGDDLYYPLYCAVVICYARPFTNNKPFGALSSKLYKINNRKYQGLHNMIMKARHELIAHSDYSIRKAMIVPPGVEIGRFEDRPLKSSGIGTQTSFYMFPHDVFHEILGLATSLGKRIQARISEIIEDLYGGMDLPSKSFYIRIDDGL